MPKRPARRIIITSKQVISFVVVILLLAVVFYRFDTSTNPVQDVAFNSVVNSINDGKVKKVSVSGNEIKVELTDGTKQKTIKESTSSFVEIATALGAKQDKLAAIELGVKDEADKDFWINLVFFVVAPILIVGGIVWFILRSVSGVNNRAMMFGQANAKKVEPEHGKPVTFKDVAGSKEAKVELAEIVEFLKTPEKFRKLGAKIPKGVLLMGSPGTGKTLLARAVAGEAHAPFFHISGSEFVEMFVGVGASRVRDLFKVAKEAGPSIIFIDEIDAVGRQRGSGLGGSHDEREQTLNQILVEMDGFDNKSNVIVVAATNRPDVLDPALLRPGRFDRRVVLDLPDIKEREAILQIHAKNKPLTKHVNLGMVAQRTPGFSGADLANVLNEAAIIAARSNQTTITREHVMDAIEKVILGPERRSRVFSLDEKKVTAYHEAGHAVLSHVLPDADPVHKVSIISRGRAGGFTMSLPDADRNYKKHAEFLAELVVLMGGYTTEKIIFGDVTTGASNDLQKATQMARRLVMEFGMSEEFGPINFTTGNDMIFLGKDLHEGRNHSEETQTEIDQAVRKTLRTAYAKAQELLAKHRDKLDLIARELIAKETIEKEEFALLMGAGDTGTVAQGLPIVEAATA